MRIPRIPRLARLALLALTCAVPLAAPFPALSAAQVQSPSPAPSDPPPAPAPSPAPTAVQHPLAVARAMLSQLEAIQIGLKQVDPDAARACAVDLEAARASFAQVEGQLDRGELEGVRASRELVIGLGRITGKYAARLRDKAPKASPSPAPEAKPKGKKKKKRTP